MSNFQVIIRNKLSTDADDLDAVIWVKAEKEQEVLEEICLYGGAYDARVSILPDSFVKGDGIDVDLSLDFECQEFRRLLNNPPFPKQPS